MDKDVFRKRSGILRRLSNEASEKDKKTLRKVLLIVFLVTIFLIGGFFLSVQIPKWIINFNEEQTVVTVYFDNISPTPVNLNLDKEKNEIKDLVKNLRGEYGIYYYNFSDNSFFEINGNKTFITASIKKLPLMISYYLLVEKGKINPDTLYTLKDQDKAGGAGSLYLKPTGAKISYRKAVELMGQQSDNTAQNIISNLVGKDYVEQVIKEIGLNNTSFAEDRTTPEDISLLFKKVYNNQLLSKENKEEFFTILTNGIWEDRIPAGIPKTINVAHKVGTLDNVVSDAGIVFTPKPFILTILSQDVDIIEAQKVLPEIAKKIYEIHISKE